MSDLYRKFVNSSEKTAFDSNVFDILEKNINQYNESHENAKSNFNNLQLAKKKVAKIRKNVLFDLEDYLKEFETNFSKNGGKLIWAPDKSFAIDAVVKILKSNNAKNVIKSKSMISEEINLNKHLEKQDFKVLETDLGEYIVQLEDEKPYHIVTPAMHKNKSQINDLLDEKFEIGKNKTAEEITDFVRNKLRPDFIHADAGITGANFLLADTGAIALTENEGNAILSATMPKTHIVIAGIEKVIPSYKDLDLIWQLLSTYATGQDISAYNSVIKAPQNKDEQIYLILVDNGRTNVLKSKHQYEALSCIKCGACINACPVYKTVGGHTYDVAYPGPIGSVLLPLMEGFDKYNHLSYACTDCGKCDDVCPVNIPLSHLLIRNRKQAVNEGFEFDNLKKSIKLFKKISTKNWIIEKSPAFIQQSYLSSALKPAWGKRKTVPKFASKTFSERWKEERE